MLRTGSGAVASNAMFIMFIIADVSLRRPAAGHREVTTWLLTSSKAAQKVPLGEKGLKCKLLPL